MTAGEAALAHLTSWVRRVVVCSAATLVLREQQPADGDCRDDGVGDEKDRHHDIRIHQAAFRRRASCAMDANGVTSRGRRTILRSSGKTAAMRRTETKCTRPSSDTTRTSGRGGRPP